MNKTFKPNSLYLLVNVRRNQSIISTQSTVSVSLHPSRLLLVAVAIASGIVLGYLFRDIPIMGYDWMTMFAGNQATDIYYPPWTSIVLWPLAELPARLGLALLSFDP